MIYDPLPTLTIAGIDYTGETINAITTTSGRQTVDEQPRPGYATVQLIITDNSYPEIQLNDPAHITVKDSSGVDTRIFSGYVTDVARQVVRNGSYGVDVMISITLAGPLANLAKIETAPSYPKEFDGDRIEQILIDFQTADWTEVDPALTWATVDPATTWLTFDKNTFVGSIDTPGSYEITAYSAGATNAYSHAQMVATSALGVLWEDQDGLINYSDAASRINDVAQNGFTTIDAQFVAGVGLNTRTATADLINEITISYKASATETGVDLASQYAYGRFAGQKSTLLENKADAEAMVALYLQTRANPRTTIPSVTIPLHNESLPGALRDALLNAYVGMPLAIPDLPAAILNRPFSGFLEGISYTAGRKAAAVTLYLSEYALSQIEQAWQQVEPTERWNTLISTLTWENAEVIA